MNRTLLNRSTRCACATIVALAVIGVPSTLALAQAAPAPSTRPTESAEIDIRVYDVSDLVRPIRNYPVKSETSERGRSADQEASATPTPATAAAARDDNTVSADAIMQVLIDVVAPESWKVNGGADGTISKIKAANDLNQVLLIAQTNERHRQIGEVLAQIRGQRGAQVMICTRTYWLMMTPADAQAAFDAAKAAAPKFADGEFAIGSMPVVDDALLARCKLYGQGQTICFNGQTVAIESGRERQIVSDLTPVVGQQAVGYDPTISSVTSGTSVQVTPQLTVDGEAVLLDVHGSVCEDRATPKPAASGPKPAASEPKPAAPEAKNAAQGDPLVPTLTAIPPIDLPDVVRQTFATTVRLPLGKRVLLMGMTLEPQTTSDAAGRQLYLAVEVTAVR